MAEARAFQRLARQGLSQRAIAARAGVRQPYVNKRLALLALDERAAAAIENAGLGIAHLYALCPVQAAGAQRRLARHAIEGRWSVRTLERAVNRERAGLPRAARQWAGAHPDAAALAERLEDAIGTAVGVPLSVTVLRGHRFDFRYTAESADAARTVAQQLGAELDDEDAL